MVSVLVNFYFRLKHVVNIKVTTDGRLVKDDSQQISALAWVVLIYSCFPFLKSHKENLIKSSS